VQINDARVSRTHMRVSRQDGKYFVHDLNSSNGSSVNKNPIGPDDGPVEVKPGADLIAVGTLGVGFVALFPEPSDTIARLF
jgi:pSer/pThr/pTyr-binding forkhead associated (FHA) protein